MCLLDLTRLDDVENLASNPHSLLNFFCHSHVAGRDTIPIPMSNNNRAELTDLLVSLRTYTDLENISRTYDIQFRAAKVSYGFLILIFLTFEEFLFF